MAEPASRFFQSARMKLHYLDWGNDGAPPLILMHGGRDHAHSWDWVAQALRDAFHIVVPDLRGHGDSDWSADGHYSVLAHVQDLAELVEQLGLAPAAIVAHSFGGAISLRYAGLFPDTVRAVVAIEGIGGTPQQLADYESIPFERRITDWIGDMRRLTGRPARHYGSLDEAEQRMREENSRLSPDQIRHLVLHGTRRNADGNYSWKFDNLVRNTAPVDITPAQRIQLWERITCPLLLINGTGSWATNPAEDGRLKHFRDARVRCSTAPAIGFTMTGWSGLWGRFAPF